MSHNTNSTTHFQFPRFETKKLGDFDKVYIELTKDVATQCCSSHSQVLRERDGIPDLRRAAQFHYVIVTLPEVDGPVRKLLKGGRDLDDILTAAVIRNLKAVQHQWPLRTQEIVLVLPYAAQLLHHNLLSVPCLNPEAGTLSQIYQVIVMDADGSRSKGIARSLRKLWVKARI
ncbi:hypothetical protein NC651_040373 [Populus alba x Populus x berolinensis]|nr:hypothetical protein NC651_040373 [Populus alba x Populus x berolinensis]